MAFEVYNFENIVSSNSPNIRIGEKSIVFNKIFLDLLDTKKVVLAYDPKIKTIKIKPATENEKGAVEIDKSKIPAAGFLDHFEITQRGRFEAKFKEGEQAYFVKL